MRAIQTVANATLGAISAGGIGAAVAWSEGLLALGFAVSLALSAAAAWAEAKR